MAHLLISFWADNAAACSGIQVRGFAPIGMLEYWNIGKMGFGILECWANGIIVLTIKQKLIISFKKLTIPSFHYSIIP